MRRALSIPRAALVLVALLAAGGSGPPAAGAIRPVAHPVALGVTTHGVSSSSRHPGRALRRYAAHVGGMPRVVMWYQTWYAGPLVVRRVMDPVENHGAIPMITWMPLAAPSKAVSLAGIAAGKDDAYLKQSAADARAWGHRFLVRPFHEMNGRWTPWAVGSGGRTAQQFVAAWRHIVSVFRSAGATNVRFVFSPNVISSNSPSFRDMYPGDRYVDRVALDGYNWGTSRSGQHWRSFYDTFARSYSVLARLSARPMMIAETASTEQGGDKALWITHAFRRDMSRFPRVRAVIWFNHRKETSWPVGSSSASLSAYRKIVKAE
jgi:hypothetical protein